MAESLARKISPSALVTSNATGNTSTSDPT